jgi:ribosomal protein S18 acetylase RimI-like enzyme
MHSIQKADITAIPAIQQIAKLTWPVTYNNILPEGQLDYMLQRLFNDAALKQQIENGYQYLLALAYSIPVGFASYSKKDDPSTYKLNRLYIHPDQQGKGIGKLLLDHIIQDILLNNATHLEVNVNRHNKALLFYQKNGFEIIKEEDIDIGNGYFMNDYVLCKQVVNR